MAMISDRGYSDLDPDNFGGGGDSGGNANNLIRIDENNGGGGSTGSGNQSGGGIKLTPTGESFRITSNIDGASISINGTYTGKTTPAQINITKSSLIDGGNKTITISKNGYSTNEKYIISLDTKGQQLIRNPELDNEFGNLGVTEIQCKYYVNNTEVSKQIYGSPKVLGFSNLSLSDDSIDDSPELFEFKVNLSGIQQGNPIVIQKNDSESAEFFPNMGITEYSDIAYSKYQIKSVDTTLYRMTKITYDGDTGTVPLVPAEAGDNESLSLTIKLRHNITINIEVESVVRGNIDFGTPEIRLINPKSRTYNINSEIGVPIAFEKNEDVKAITIIVGDDVLEYDDLEKGDTAGVTIPHSVFDKIGKYNSKIFPFSLSDYEDFINPPEEIKTKDIRGIGGQYNPIGIFEEVKEEPVNNDNPYVNTNPNYSPGTGGSSGNNDETYLPTDGSGQFPLPGRQDVVRQDNFENVR